MKMIHVSAGGCDRRVWTDVFCRELAKLGDVEIVENGAGLDEAALLARLRSADVLLGAWSSLRLPEAPAAARTRRTGAEGRCAG